MKFEYLRPKSLSSDKSNIIDAIFHGIDWLKKRKNLSFDAVILLQPTSPLRNIKDFKRALNTFKKNHNQTLVSVTKILEHPYALVNVKKNNWNLTNQDDILGKLIDFKTDFLAEKFDEYKNDLPSSTLKKFDRFLDQQYEDDVINDIKDELKLILYNNRKLPLKTKQELELINDDLLIK